MPPTAVLCEDGVAPAAGYLLEQEVSSSCIPGADIVCGTARAA